LGRQSTRPGQRDRACRRSDRGRRSLGDRRAARPGEALAPRILPRPPPQRKATNERSTPWIARSAPSVETSCTVRALSRPTTKPHLRLSRDQSQARRQRCVTSASERTPSLRSRSAGVILTVSTRGPRDRERRLAAPRAVTPRAEGTPSKSVPSPWNVEKC
jgi:hypothetical protein